MWGVQWSVPPRGTVTPRLRMPLPVMMIIIPVCVRRDPSPTDPRLVIAFRVTRSLRERTHQIYVVAPSVTRVPCLIRRHTESCPSLHAALAPYRAVDTKLN